jgi:hypothetical protein
MGAVFVGDWLLMDAQYYYDRIMDRVEILLGQGESVADIVSVLAHEVAEIRQTLDALRRGLWQK